MTGVGTGDSAVVRFDAVFKPVRKISDMQCVHIIKPDLRDLILTVAHGVDRPACERVTSAGAGDHQPLLIQLPLDLAARDRRGLLEEAAVSSSVPS